MVTTSMTLWAMDAFMVTLCILTADTGEYTSPSCLHVLTSVMQ